MPGRTYGETVGIELDLTDATRSPDAGKYVHQSSSGNVETINESIDVIWTLVFAPVFGSLLARLNEFLASTAGGELFKVWIYGTEASPILLRRTDNGFEREAFVNLGRGGDDPTVVRITAIESS